MNEGQKQTRWVKGPGHPTKGPKPGKKDSLRFLGVRVWCSWMILMKILEPVTRSRVKNIYSYLSDFKTKIKPHK